MRNQKAHVLAASVRKLLRRNAYGHVANLVLKLRSGDISHIMMDLSPREQASLFSILLSRDRQLAAETLNDLGLEAGLEILKQVPPQEVTNVLQELASDDAAVFISALPEELASEVLERMRSEESTEVQELLQYKEETAGRIMTPNVFALHEEVTVGEAIHAIQTAPDLEMVFYLYVTDDRDHLVGVCSLRQLLMVPPNTPLKKVMTADVISVTSDTDQEEVARQVALYDLLAIPVVDHENKLVGVITVDDVIDVIKEEASEDIFYLAGVGSDEHVYTSAEASIRKRLPWLMINLATALVAATVVAFYEPTIARYAFLAVFMPVVAGMGGNCGIQTLTVMVRGLAMGELTWEGSKGAVFKEVMVAIANGLVLGIVAGLVAFLWKGNFMLGVILGTAMIINIFVAGIMGSSIPLLLKKINVDPAIASGIFLTTFTDIIGFFSFLGLASLLLHYFPVG